MKNTHLPPLPLQSWVGKTLVFLFASVLISACSNDGTSAPPPNNIVATAGDGRVTLSWTGESDVDYWYFGSTDATLSSSNWSKLPNAMSRMNIHSPTVVCNLTNTTPYYFALNGRRNGGPGGAFSPVVMATPRTAGEAWQPLPNLGSDDWLDVAERTNLPCVENPTDSGVNYVAVGPQGKIATSSNANSWNFATNTPSDFSKSLYAVATSRGSAARWVAVGEEGVSLISTDGTTWTQGANAVTGMPNLRGLASNGTLFIAVGDNGTIKSTTDGVTWTSLTSGVNENLLSIAYSTAGYFVAVGANGTILISVTGSAWTPINSGTTSTLNSVATGAFLSANNVQQHGVIVAGTGDVALFSNDGGLTFTNVYSGANFGGQAGLNFVATAHYSRFVLADSTGQAWLTTNGTTWNGPFVVGTTPKALIGADGRYVAVGAAGSIATSF